MVDRFHQCEVEKNNDNKQQKTKKLGLEIIFEQNMKISWNAFFDERLSGCGMKLFCKLGFLLFLLYN